MKRKLLAMILAVAMCLPMAIPVGANGVNSTTGALTGTSGDGLVLNKYITDNNDGSFKVNLESYVTGNVTTSVTHIPTDVILVLDTSGSMNEYFGKTIYKAMGGTETNKQWLDTVMKKNFLGNYKNRNKIFYKPDNLADEDGNYYAIAVEYKWVLDSIIPWSGHYKYDYTVSKGGKTVTTITSLKKDDTALDDISFDLQAEIDKILGTKGKMYTSNGKNTKLEVLKETANGFINNVKQDAIDNNVENRVAVVTFDDEETSAIMDGASKLHRKNFNDGDATFNAALKAVKNTAGYDSLMKSLDSLEAGGATRADTGFVLADKVVTASKNIDGANNVERSKTVIFLTDGVPTSSNEFNETVANGAIEFSEHIKSYSTPSGAKLNSVYSIGIYDGAEPSQFIKYSNCNTENKKANRFMNLVSSNCPQETYLTNPQTVKSSNNYFLKANSVDELKDVFKTISEQIATPSVALDSKTVLKDVVSQYFTLPKDMKTSDVKVETVDCTGKNSGGYAFSSTKNDITATVAVDIDTNTVNVSGFDYSKNFCSDTEYTQEGKNTFGKKLVVSFDVTPKVGFVGGNDVPTNAQTSGIYNDTTATEPIKPFVVPTANVPIKASFDKTSVNIYAGNSIPDLNGTINSAGDSWKYDYVDVTSTSDKNYNTLHDGTATNKVTLTPKTDGTKSVGTKAETKTVDRLVDVSVFKPTIACNDSEIWLGEKAPSYETANLDSTKAEYIHKNKDGTESKDTDVAMNGDKPELILYYDTPLAAFEDDTPVSVVIVINKSTGTDIKHATTFTNPVTQDSGKNFTVKVKTCNLNVEKAFVGDKTNDNEESFVINIKGSGNDLASKIDMQVVVTKSNLKKTIVGLPIGDYSVTEDGAWSWKYTASNPDKVTLNMNNKSGSVTVNNSFTDNHWFDGYSFCENVFKSLGGNN